MNRSVVGVVAGVIFAAVAIFLVFQFMPASEPVPPQAAKPAPAVEPQVAATEPAPLVPLREATAVEPSAGWRGAVPAGARVRVSNGTGRPLMGSRFANYFKAHGLSVNLIRNANSYEYPRTLIFYNPDQRDNAFALAATLPFPVRMAEAKVGRGEIEFVLGFDLVTLDEALKTAPPA